MNNSNININGRVNILQPDPSIQFSIYDKIACDSNTSDYRQPLKGNWNESPLSRAYFSAQNIQIIQNSIRAGVHKMSKELFIISPQCTDTLKIIMRSIFLTYSANKPNDIPEQITALNKIVLDYCIPQVYGEAQGYIKYLEDASTLVVPISHPIKVDVNDKTLSENVWF
jgi:hypothetical protein